MCDFRTIQQIKLFPEEKTLNINQSELKSASSRDKWQNRGSFEVGFYHICGTGAYYAYYDGQDWRHEYFEPSFNHPIAKQNYFPNDKYYIVTIHSPSGVWL